MLCICVSVSGDAYCPLLVFAKESMSRHVNSNIHDWIDIRIEIAHSPYVMKESFLAYLTYLVIPSIESNRNLTGCQEKPTIIFCENCSCHCSEDILEELANHGILLITYPLHSSQIFQVLNVLLFGRLKSATKYLPRDDNQDPQVDHAMRIFRVYEITTMSSTVRDS
jgi:hypothetical protein